MNLFLDDERDPEDVFQDESPFQEAHPWREFDWTVVRTMAEFKRALREHGTPERVSFDYVLDGEGKGDRCAMTLAMVCHREGESYPEWNVHSTHSEGASKIVEVVRSFGRRKANEVRAAGEVA